MAKLTCNRDYNFVSFSFKHIAPLVWNALPQEICQTTNFNGFKRKFKCYLLQVLNPCILFHVITRNSIFVFLLHNICLFYIDRYLFPIVLFCYCPVYYLFLMYIVLFVIEWNE